MSRHTFGLEFKKILKEKELRQTALAKRAGIDKSTISKWLVEGGNRPTVDNLDSVSDALGIEQSVLRDLAKEQWHQHALEYMSVEERQQAIGISEQEIIKKPEIPTPDTTIYFPLRLAKEVKEKVENPDGRHEIFIPDYPGWVEQEEKWRNRLEIKAADEVLDKLLDTTGLHVIVGEPGGGKTTLLRNLGRNLQNQVNVLPLYVPFRSVKSESIRDFFDNTWKKAIPPYDVLPYLENGFPKDVKVVWLFDGWDELAGGLREQWKKLINDQKEHVCLVSCRIAQYNNDFGKPYYLMGLYSEEQKQFLSDLATSWKDGEKADPHFSNVTDAWIDELHSKLQENEQLRHLAGSPLLLTLIAKTNNPAKGIELPLKRIDFYRKAFRSLIEQRQKLELSSLRVNKLRKFLAKLSFATNQNGIRAEFSLEDFLNLAEECKLSEEDTTLIVKSNLLKITTDDRCQWLHLTFAEWLLAEYWLSQANTNLLQVIKEHWQHPDYEEALALLWSISKSEEHTQAIDFLTRANTAPSKKEEGRARSALKLVVHLYSRSSIEHSEEQFTQVWSCFTNWPLRKIALANTKNLNQDFIKKLASDKDVRVREGIAERDNLLDENLKVKLANDEDSSVRFGIASLKNLQDSIMEKLASDEDLGVRWCIARHNNLSERLIEKLVSDKDSFVRQSIAVRTNLSDKLIEELANDEDASVRWRIATRTDLQNDLREKLDNDEDFESIAFLENIPETITEKIFSNENFDSVVTHNNLANHLNNLSDRHVEELASDEDSYVRFLIIERDNLSDSVIEKLASDKEVSIRANIALRDNLTEKIIKKLVNDKYSGVRGSIALNRNLSDSYIKQLANDKDSGVRWNIAKRIDVCWEWLIFEDKQKQTINEDLEKELENDLRNLPN